MLKYCFKCDKQIESVFNEGQFEHDPHDPPWQATVWTTTGNYGSQIYDSYEGEYLEILICDDCVLTNKHRVVEYDKTDLKVPELTCPPKSLERHV